MIKTYKQAVITIDENVWAFIYDTDSKKILMEPQRCSGTYTCPQTLVVADSLEECEEYINDNDIIYSTERDAVTADFIENKYFYY